jgi:hypothetical protein
VTNAVVLRCPSCGQELPALDADRVWACASCRTALEIEGDALAPRPYRCWRPAGRARDDTVWLPFWRVEHDAEIDCDDARARAAAEDAASAGRSWVRAFWLENAFLLGDPGQAMSAEEHAEHLSDHDLPVCVGARVGSAEALRLAELFVLARADRVADVTPVTLRLVPRETALVAVPFALAERDVVCAVDGRRFRRTTIPDLDAIRATAALR